MSNYTSKPLNRSYIGIVLHEDDYQKIKALLPTPSYIDIIYSSSYRKVALIYQIEGHITSYKQYRWISNIKLGLQDFIFVKFDYVKDYCITDSSIINNCTYTISELSKAFKAPLIDYPKIMYASNKKEIYQRLCWYGKRLVHQKCFTKEAMISAGLLMNKVLEDSFSSKDLYKKSIGAYEYINEYRDDMKVKLSADDLKEAYSRGGKVRKTNQAIKTKELIGNAVKTGLYYKKNGTVNAAKLAKDINMSRKTVVKYV